ncbi:MAG TPA: uracil-DNA glycosylase [Chthoniobacterales bacterium]|nr:uracil-DNA glycosylase [Chthoniobacterales bacterium]
MSIDRFNAFATLINEVTACTTCHRMRTSSRVLNYSSGKPTARVMFIGEAPGRLGADASEIPFHGDRAGENFEDLLAFAGIQRSEIFVTNAVLCNPKDDAGNNATPSVREIANCAGFLRRQIDLVDPEVIATLGATALAALNAIEPHALSLSTHVRTAKRWNGRILVPLYHPGQRAMMHRKLAQQHTDYRFLRSVITRVNKHPRKSAGITRSDILAIAKYLLSRCGSLGYFQLHKLAYLTEYIHVRQTGRRLTSAYFIRQADGPYCTDLEINRLRRSDGAIRVFKDGDKLRLTIGPDSTPRLFEDAALSHDARAAADDAIRRYAEKDDADLKTAAYLTAPMRFLLRQEKTTNRTLLNAPINFLAAA